MMLFTYDWIVIPLITICVFVLSYLWSDRIIERLKNATLGQRQRIIEKLDLMFVKVEPEKVTWTLIAMSAGLGLLAFAAAWPNIQVGLFLFVALTIAGWRIPGPLVNYLYEKRCATFVNQMVDGMTIMANGIRSGLSITQSMERVVENMSNPIRQEFRLVLSEVQLGRSLEEALNDLGERIPKPDVQMFVTSVNILKETGGNMAETFQTIMYTIRERQKIEKKIEALTAQGIMQGVIITMVPFFLLVIFFIVDPAFVNPLFTTALGWFALLLMLFLQVMGGMMIRKIVKINV